MQKSNDFLKNQGFTSSRFCIADFHFTSGFSMAQHDLFGFAPSACPSFGPFFIYNMLVPFPLLIVGIF